MVEATVALRNGEVMTVYANDFEELFTRLEEQEQNIVQITGRTIKLNAMRQGKEKLTYGNAL